MNPREEARRAARKLLATQSCTEDSLTAALFEFAQQNIQYVATRVFDELEKFETELCDQCKEKLR